MAERNENVISWNVPNVISIWLMVALLWTVLGIGSHLLFRKKSSGGGVKTDNSGNYVTA